MSAGDDVFTGEYFVSLKGYKIPLKSPDRTGQFEINNPPPPGTESEDEFKSIDKTNTFMSPLAAVKRPPQPRFEQPAPASAPLAPTPNPQSQGSPTVAKPTNKRSSLFMMPSAEGLPEELIKLFKPLCCDLCSAKLNSPSSARLHYESKNHVKKINNWLGTWAEQTGEPVAKRQAVNKEGPKGPNALHCDVCDLALTSLQHAKQHNMGKRHKNALAGRGKPSGAGYYDSNNKWVRTSKIIPEDPTNRFCIGEAFLIKKDSDAETVIVPESVLKSPPPPPPPETFPDIDAKNESTTVFESNSFDISADDLVEAPAAPSTIEPVNEAQETAQEVQSPKGSIATDPSKYCEICDISVTSEMHMRLHLAGAKHAKKLRQLGEPPYTEVPHTISQCIIDEPIVKRPKNTTASDGSIPDYSVFRTPSGQFYCQVCDLSVTSEVTLSQHFASKRHIKTAKKK